MMSCSLKSDSSEALSKVKTGLKKFFFETETMGDEGTGIKSWSSSSGTVCTLSLNLLQLSTEKTPSLSAYCNVFSHRDYNTVG